MNINQISGLERILASQERSPVKREVGQKADRVDFSGAEALNRALEEETDVRADRLQSVLETTSSMKYPPDELIAGISKLLADTISKGDAEGDDA